MDRIRRTQNGYAAHDFEVIGLPPRASQVLLLRANGLTIPAAAKELGCGVETVKNRIKDLFYKLGANNTAQLITNAMRSGHLKIQ